MWGGGFEVSDTRLRQPYVVSLIQRLIRLEGPDIRPYSGSEF